MFNGRTWGRGPSVNFQAPAGEADIYILVDHSAFGPNQLA
jgi:hypothetical protein